MSEPIAPALPKVFDRRRHRMRRQRAASRFTQYAFLKDRIAQDLAERLFLVKRRFSRVLDLGAHSGQVGQAVAAQLSDQAWQVHADTAHAFAALGPASSTAIAIDEENLPFADNSFDLIVSGMSLHWVNDLPGALIQIRKTLAPDGLFLGALIGGASLSELRQCLLEAEIAARGGASQRVSPFADTANMADLLQRAGFVMPVSDTETIEVYYRTPMDLLKDLQGMGETAAPAQGTTPLTRSILDQALRLYAQNHTDERGRILARFEIITASAWSPGPGQPKVGPPGFARSGQVAPGGLPHRH